MLIKLTCVSYTSFLLFPVLPDVRGPKGQESDESQSNLEIISGVTVAGLLVVVVLLTVVVFCALKFRAHSKSVNLPASKSAGFGKQITFCHDNNHMQI